MLKTCLIAILLISVTPFVQAEVITIKKIEEMSQSVEKDTLVLFNIAEVLLDSQVSLGTSPWRKYVKKLAPNWKDNPGVNVHDQLTLFSAKYVPHRSVEPLTPQLIKKWQQDGIVVMALTSRGKSEWYDTEIEGVDVLTENLLKKAGIDFTLTQLPPGFDSLDSSFDLTYGRGILYATHGSKEELIQAILEATNYHPKKIVFVDDKKESLDNVDVAMKALGIPFTGYWYRRTAEDHRDFNPMIAHIQLETLLIHGKLLTDQEAQQILNAMKPTDPDQYLIDILNWINWETLTK